MTVIISVPYIIAEQQQQRKKKQFRFFQILEFYSKSNFEIHALGKFLKREIKFDVTWSHVKQQTAKMISEFVFFSSNPSLNHLKIEKCLLLIATNTNIFTLLFNELKTDGKSFIFAVRRLTYDYVTSNLISLKCQICPVNRFAIGHFSIY